MDRVELADIADQMVTAYREILLLDHFYKINVEVTEGEFYCNCIKDDKSPLSWIIQVNPSEHRDEYDVQYSILEALLKVLFCPLEEDTETKRAIIARLTTTFCNLLGGEDEEEEDEDEEYEEDEDD